MTDEAGDRHLPAVLRRGRELVPELVLSRDGMISPGDRDRHGNILVELARFMVEAGRLLWSVARDQEVPWHAKVVAGGAMAYVASPIDLIPDFIPGIGQADDLMMLVGALRYLANVAGYDKLREHWTGSDDGFALVLVLAGVKA